MSVNDSKIESVLPQSIFLSKFKYFCLVTILDISLMSRSCKTNHVIFKVGTPSLEARNIRLFNIIASIIEESKLI